MSYSEELLRQITLRQRDDRLSDRAFAVKVQTSRQTWQGIRTGTLPLSPKIINIAVSIYPELWALAAFALLGRPKKGDSLLKRLFKLVSK